MLSIRELEIMKAALECDTSYQKKELKKMGDDIRFEVWLNETKAYSKKYH